jgi:hypothetical protein
MTLLNRIEQVSKLWAIMLPHVQAPEPAWVGRWCDYPDKIIEKAIVRATKKFRTDSTVAPEAVWRYVSSVVRNEAAAREDVRKAVTA